MSKHFVRAVVPSVLVVGASMMLPLNLLGDE